MAWFDGNLPVVETARRAPAEEIYEAVTLSPDRLDQLAQYMGVQLTQDRDGHYLAIPQSVDPDDPEFRRNFVSYWSDQATVNGTAERDRQRRLITFKAMDQSMAEASIALDTYADEALGVGFIDNPINVRISDTRVNDTVLSILKNSEITSRSRSMMRNLIKYGDLGYKVIVPKDPAKVASDIALEYVDPLGWQCMTLPQSPTVTGFNIGEYRQGHRDAPNSGKKDIVQLWEFIQLSVFDEDSKPYGRSLLEPMRVDFDHLVTMEALLALTRAAKVDRLVIKVPTGSANAVQAAQKLTQVKAQLKNVIFKDTSLGAKSYARTPSLNEMVFMPSDAGFDITRLPSSVDLTSTEDVDYFRNKVFTVTGLPKGFFLHDDTFSRGAALAQQDILFARKLIQYQNAFTEGLAKLITILSVYVAGANPMDLEVRVELKRPHQLASSLIEYYKVLTDTASEMITTWSSATQQIPPPEMYGQLLQSLGMPIEVTKIFNQVQQPDKISPTYMVSSNSIVRTNKDVFDLEPMFKQKVIAPLIESRKKAA